MIPGYETPGRSGTENRFSYMRKTICGSFARVSGGVGSHGVWWIQGQSYTTCSPVSSPTPQFIQMVYAVRPILCSQYSFCVGHFTDDPSSSTLSLTTLILLCGQAFLLSRHTPGEFLHGRLPPSGSMPDGGVCRVVVVWDVTLIFCSSFSGLFIWHLIPHYSLVAWTPGEGDALHH